MLILILSLNLNHIIVGSAYGSQCEESESIENVNTAQPLSDTASAKKPEPSRCEEKASCQEPESDVSSQSVLADNQPHTRKVVDDPVKGNEQLRNEMVAATAGSKRKRKFSDDDNKNG